MTLFLDFYLHQHTLKWRLNMLKYTLKVLIPLSIIFLVGCTPKGISPIPKNFIGDIDEIRPLTAEELAENKKTLDSYEQKLELLEKRASEDVAEKKELLKEKEVVEKAKKQLSELTKKIVTKRRKALLKKEVKIIADSVKKGFTEKDILDILEKVADGNITEEEAKKLLKDKTSLSDDRINELLSKVKTIQKDSEALSKKLAVASAEEITEILRDAGGVSEIDILALVEKKKEVELKEVSFLERTMSKIYTRLVRDRELGVEEAFCVNIVGILDHLMVSPSYFESDKHSIDDYLDQISNSFELLQPILDEYPDVVVSLEGNADERGTIEYNKALSDRRWETPSKVLQALYFDEEKTLGVGRSEQCPLPRVEGTSTSDWWSKNRRTDYIFKLK
jgi:outer membrane protein OmpA-like peptidoglycan-associated protein